MANVTNTPTTVTDVSDIEGKRFVFYEDPGLLVNGKTFKIPGVNKCLLNKGDTLDIVRDENFKYLGIFGQACVGCVFAKNSLREGGCKAVYRK